MKRAVWSQFVVGVHGISIRVRLRLRLFADATYDLGRFSSFARGPTKRDRERLRALVISLYHVLEKGLAMPERKLNFGRDQSARLVGELERWRLSGFGEDVQFSAAADVLREYCQTQSSPDVASFLAGLTAHGVEIQGGQLGGTEIVSSSLLETLGKGDFAQLTNARRSIRAYSSEPVSKHLLVEAVRLAQRSPSVCNRQSSRVFWTNRRLEIDSVLALQSGNRGFGHQAQALMVVTGELRAFEGSQERNQVWVDGGMFAMSLLYALTHLGLGACALNWSVPAQKDQALRRAIAIPNSHSVIMMISIGHLPSENTLPRSQRNLTAEVLFPLRLR